MALAHLGEGQALPGPEVGLAQALLDRGRRARGGPRRPAPSPGSGASGELTIAWTVPRAASAAAARSACARPAADSSGSVPPLPENRFSGVSGGLAVPQQDEGGGRPEVGRRRPALGRGAATCPAARASASAALRRARPAPSPPRPPRLRAGHPGPAGAATCPARRSSAGLPLLAPLARVHRLVGEPVRVLVLLARDPLVRHLRRPADGRRPRRRAGFMSGCLIFQRPDICSTTSLESIRTRTDGLPGRGRCAARRPAIRPRYSATLFVATPMYSAASARVSPVTGVDDDRAVARGPRVAPGPAVGLDDELPRHGSTGRSRTCAPGCGGSSRSARRRRAARPAPR